MTGKGSLNHNSRKFHAKNTDPNRTHWNVEYCNEDIKDVYHELFDDALKRYNDKQTRKDRKIDDYYEKIRSGKQEKLFHEVILQIGDKDNMGSETMEGQLAAKILDEYMKENVALLNVAYDMDRVVAVLGENKVKEAIEVAKHLEQVNAKQKGKKRRTDREGR